MTLSGGGNEPSRISFQIVVDDLQPRASLARSMPNMGSGSLAFIGYLFHNASEVSDYVHIFKFVWSERSVENCPLARYANPISFAIFLPSMYLLFAPRAVRFRPSAYRI